jgi:hypothetical protein
MASGVRINHGSAYARDPRAAAHHLAALSGGVVESFHPLEGAWACLLDGGWSGALIEFYPRTATLAHDEGLVLFRPLEHPAAGGGTHFNLSLPRSRADLERTCRERGLPHAWRDWAGFLDVWLEDDLLIECVPDATPP